MNARLLLLLAGATALGGCIDNDASVRLHAMCFPPTPTDAGLCVYPAACDSIELGVLEADVTSLSTDGPLIWPIQVDNQRPSNADRSGAVDTAIAWIEGYKIKYTVSAVAAPISIPELDVPISRHPVLPVGTTVVIAPIVPAVLGAQLAGVLPATGADLKAELRAYGHYGDGSSFETGSFQIIAKLLNGVLVAPSNDLTTTTSSGEVVHTSSFCTLHDPSKPVYVGSCPQPLQTSVVNCIAGKT
jgi:hypothetical protein